jgi:S-adenosylmethionine hydrolase
VPAIITLLTDFGTRDSYVAEMKAVLASQAHPAQLVDITHHVPPGDVRVAQYLLARVWPRFPQGSVHLVVVDPGVGTKRRALAAGAAGHFFVAPDNGILTSLPSDARFVELPVPAGAAPTFHGRDLFAPAAAELANGTALTHLGHPIADPVRSPLPVPRKDGASWVGVVIYVDRFGTLVSNIPGDAVAPGAHVKVGEREVVTSRTFGDVARGDVVAFVGSGGTVEIAVRDASAAGVLGLGVGAEVRVEVPRPTPSS